MGNKRRQTVEIYAPTVGYKADAPTEMLDPRAVSTGQNFKCYFGVNQKEYGTSLWATGAVNTVNGIPTMLFAATFPTLSVLQVMTPTNVYQYVAGSDSYTNDGQAFSGTYSDFWQGTIFATGFFYVNGVDPIQYKAAYNATGTALASAVSPDTYTAWCLQGLNGYLNLYHTVENGVEFYQRVRWSAQAPLTYMAGTTDFATGLAGAQDLVDGEGKLQAAVPLAQGMAIYFENSIHFQNYVGGDSIWNFQKMIPGVGIPGRRCAFGYQDVNYLLTYNNIYRYYGGYYLDPIGNSIKKAMFGELNQQYIANSFIDFDKREGELLVYIPTGTNSQPDICWVYRIMDQAWSRKTRRHSCGGIFQKQSGLTIADLVGPISAQNFSFGEAQVQVQSAVKLYGDPGGRVVKHDVTVYSLSQTGTSIPQVYIYDTPDLTGNKQVDPTDSSTVEFVSTMQRWQRLSIEAAGNGLANVFYSTDRGGTFRELDQSPVTLVSNGTMHQLDMDVCNPFVRIRIQSTGTNDFVGVRYMKLDFIPGQQY